MNADQLIKWFRSEVLPNLVADGRFADEGEKQTLRECKFEDISYGVNSFASIPCFAELILDGSKGTTTRNILIKFSSQDEIFREKMKMDPQFRNEVSMYNVVLPSFATFLKNCKRDPALIQDMVPRCFYAYAEGDSVEKFIVILEDLRKEGYRVAESQFDLDLDHCKLSLEQLAKFHALSYAMKRRKPEDFEKLKNTFEEVWFEDEPLTREQCEVFKGRVVHRAIDYLLDQSSEVPKSYLENFRSRLEGIFDVLKDLASPTEPLSVICHGDFNRNNILFKYYANGRVEKAKLFDFQTFMYASPCFDLGFFIYMNTTLEFREKNFDDLFHHYYETLTQTVSEIVDVPQKTIVDQIPFHLFMKDFERVALHAYVTVSFFLPYVMCPSGEPLDMELKTKTFSQMAEENYVQGGEKVSRRIADIIVDFYKRKFYI